VVAAVLGTGAVVYLVLAAEAPCGRAAAAPGPARHAPDGADEAPQEDAAVATERRVLAALLQAGKRELP
jgi:hypothetical protein